MGSLIDKQAAVKVASKECCELRGVFGRIEDGLNELPTVDAVEVVRCKDCKYLSIINKAPLYAYCGKSNYIFHLFEEDTREHFCSWGERKENETD